METFTKLFGSLGLSRKHAAGFRFRGIEYSGVQPNAIGRGLRHNGRRHRPGLADRESAGRRERGEPEIRVELSPLSG
jgi:hypothetical protein